MPMRITLDVPEKHPRWATGTNRTLEPDDTGPDKPNKDDGHESDYKPPARVQNWLDNMHYLWGRKTGGVIVSNFWPNDDIWTVDNDVLDIIFHPTFGKFGAILPGLAKFASSADAHTWALNDTFINASALGIDLLRFMFGVTGGDIYYCSADPFTTWTQITSATIGGSGSITNIHTKYPDSNKCIITKGSGMRIAATNILGAWTAPTTPPGVISTTHNSLVYAGNSVWYLSSKTATGPTTYKSTDDGDNWTGTGSQPGALGTYSNGGIAYNRTTGRLIAAFSSAAGEAIKYSDDGGDTWLSATINKRGLSGIMTVKNVYYCGGDMWLISGGVVNGATGEKAIYASIDNGLNWFIPDVNQLNNAAETVYMNGIACSERNIVVVGDEGNNVTSLSLV